MSLRQIKKNPVYYLQHLREQVKMKKSQTAVFCNENLEKEQNFKLMFNGANGNRASLKAKRVNEKSGSPVLRKTEMARKRWGTPTTPNIVKETLSQSTWAGRIEEGDEDELLRRFRRLDFEKQQSVLRALRELEMD